MRKGRKGSIGTYFFFNVGIFRTIPNSGWKGTRLASSPGWSQGLGLCTQHGTSTKRENYEMGTQTTLGKGLRTTGL